MLVAETEGLEADAFGFEVSGDEGVGYGGDLLEGFELWRVNEDVVIEA